MSKCQIKWVDETGTPTPDDNDAIGRVMLGGYVLQIRGRGIKMGESAWYNICACHAKQLAEPGMHGWIFERFEQNPPGWREVDGVQLPPITWAAK